MYLSEEGKTDWLEQSVPYEGRIECSGATEGMYYDVQHALEDTLADVRMDEDGEMRIIGIEGTVSVRIKCSTRWRIRWQMYGWMRTERCASSGLREP